MNFKFRHKNTSKHQTPLKSSNRYTLENKVVIRFAANLFLIVLMICIIGSVITFHENLIQKQVTEMKEQLFEYSSTHGFGINDILIEGRDKTTIESLNQQINLKRSDSILQINLKTLKSKIEDLPWVEKAELKRVYFPNVLQISIKEKAIIALYQTNGKFYPVDRFGNVIEVNYTPSTPLLVIVGDGAPQKLLELLKITSTSPELFGRIKAAVLHAQRRWDLIFDDLNEGITVKMPEENFAKAWKKLIKIHHKYGIFKRKLTFIDLRYPDKVVVNIADEK
ncbi:MAG: cell division protein FtsQ/DivIB [Alphaproteobacteria bacterium]|nr:cell division protein FtsQ/DivIB [Alphaproteobacteria bacterium]